MATSACAFCITDAQLIYDATNPTHPAIDGTAKWRYIPAVQSVTIRPERQEADRVRHSASGGTRVSPCSQDTITWFFDVITVLCKDDWLYRELPVFDTAVPANNDGHIREGDIFAWRIYKQKDYITTTHSADSAWRFAGKVVINNLVLDNNDDNNAQGDFTIEATTSLVWPKNTPEDWAVDMTTITFGV